MPISEIEIGDTVIAYDEETGITGEYTVTDTISHEDETIAYVTINGEEIETTPWHLFYTSEGWTEAEDLQEGDSIVSLGGVYGIVDSVIIVDTAKMMYDLTVEEVHTFAVGEGDWVVHNSCFDNARPLDEPLGQVDPDTVRYTQDSVGRNFSNGNSVETTIQGLRDGTIDPGEFPPIRVFDVDGETFSLDNRRLYVFQEAGIPINTTPATASEIASQTWKFTTNNDGVSIRVRGGGN